MSENTSTTVDTKQSSRRRQRKQQQDSVSSPQVDSPGNQHVSTPSASSPNTTDASIFQQKEHVDIKQLCENISSNNPTITTVDLSHQALTINEVAQLLDALMKNRPIHTVDLTACGLNDQAAEFIGEYIAVNTTLQNLYLDLNPFCDGGVQAILDGLEQNKTLVDMSLNEHVIPQEWVEEIDRYLMRNEELQRE